MMYYMYYVLSAFGHFSDKSDMTPSSVTPSTQFHSNQDCQLPLTFRGRDKMVVILKTTFTNASSRRKTFEFENFVEISFLAYN